MQLGKANLTSKGIAPHRSLGLLVSVVIALSGWSAHAATIYVATSGNDSTGTGASDRPYKTIGVGLTKLSAGDTLIVQDGLYQNQANFINDGLHTIPSGTASAYTTIKAANPFKVRIQNTGSTDYYDSPLRIRGNYVKVEGFVFDLRDSTSTPFVGEVQGSYNKVMKSIFRRQGAVDRYGGWMLVGGHHQLVEDVAGVGAARYGFSSGGPTSTDHHIIYRRVVGRFDFSSSVEPKATFNAYGTDGGWGVHHILYQNCIALDGQRGPSNDEHYGAWYFPKNMDTAQIVGSIALNNAVAYSGMFVQELQGKNTLVQNSVSWATTGDSGIRWNGTGSISLSNLTVGANSTALVNYNNTTSANLQNSLFVNNSKTISGNGTFATVSGNAFVASPTMGSAARTMSGTLKYLPDASNGTGLTGVGAVIVKRIGRSGTLWDDTGYDEVTNENLWPWPYEDQIKSVFAESNTPLAGNTPSTNNSVRGFTVATDKYGKVMTLTRYVWQYLGNEIPAEIYAHGTPSAPTNVSVQ